MLYFFLGSFVVDFITILGVSPDSSEINRVKPYQEILSQSHHPYYYPIPYKEDWLAH